MQINDRMLRILKIESSGRRDGSTTRALTEELVAALGSRHGDLDVVERDLANGLPFVDERWIEANFAPPDERTTSQRRVLAQSDQLVAELEDADVLVIGAPVYNFGIPAALKAWIDMIARARMTFRYTPDGPEGLLKGKKAYLVIASGGTAVESDIDFATPYLRHALKFVGISDVDVVAAERGNARGKDAIDDARMQIAKLVYTAPLASSSAA